ncbi:surface-adhesin E family protein [Achromobacter deleyi]|uniref:surface-adhesin E family protein n=1 Tax=Achromobacter deleyi TaxID=1353891 RepID=UPI001490AEA8|nr:surface-adhesin E family protein [Achromobacter deleyi]QVQ27702.1 hypothetical protein HLG70_04450 [Achromobacter deleyi]UIP23302.1 hypothetical protein LYZ39_12560 [Achromobacter deleyi]
MKGRKTIGAILLLAGSSAFATDWVELGSTERMTISIGVDQATRSGDTVVAFFRTDYSPAMTSSDSPPYDRSQIEIRVNCADLSMRAVETTYFMNERAIGSKPLTKSDEHFVLRSVGYRIERLAC